MGGGATPLRLVGAAEGMREPSAYFPWPNTGSAAPDGFRPSRGGKEVINRCHFRTVATDYCLEVVGPVGLTNLRLANG